MWNIKTKKILIIYLIEKKVVIIIKNKDAINKWDAVIAIIFIFIAIYPNN